MNSDKITRTTSNEMTELAELSSIQMTEAPEMAHSPPNSHNAPVGDHVIYDVKSKVPQADNGDKFLEQKGFEAITHQPPNREPTTRPSLNSPVDINGIGGGEPAGICDVFLIAFSYLLVICTLPLSLFFCFKVVQEYERAVIFRLGRLSKGGARGPGLFFILPCTDNYCKCDLRTVSFNVPPQEVLSKDSVTVSVDAVVYYRIQNATIAVSNVANYDSSTQLLAATTLRTVLGTKSLSEILSEREHISHVMQSSLDEATAPWGIKVERVEIKDVRLPQQMQRAMAAEAEAQREARAKVIAAEGEQRASRALKEAADVISDSPGALQLRYLQTLTSIAAEKNSTVVFPLPMELMRGLGLGKG